MTYPIPTHEQILSDRADRATDRSEEVWAIVHHEKAVSSGLEASIRELTSYKHMTRDELASRLIESIDRSHTLADQLCPLPAADVLEGNATTGFAA